MSETDDIASFPPGRYGRRRETRPPRRSLIALVAIVAVAAGFAIAVKLYDQYGDPEYNGEVLAFDTDERQVSITFRVDKPAGEPAICRVRARSADGAEVGSEEVPIPAGATDSTSVELTHVLHTSGRPVTGEVQRCYSAE